MNAPTTTPTRRDSAAGQGGAGTPTPARRLGEVVQRNAHTMGLLTLAVAVAILFSALSPAVYASGLNVQSIAFAVPEIGLMALAIAIAMTTAGIDLSTVAVANLAALTAAYVSLQGQEAGSSTATTTLIAVAAALVVGMVCGVINAVVVAVLKVAPILATLATQMIFAGVAITLTSGRPLYSLTPELASVGTATLAGVPVIFWMFLAVVAVAWFLMVRTGYGLRAVMIGANPVATRYSGISSTGTLVRTYVLTGTISAVAGLLMVIRTGSASADYGSSYLFLAVTIAVLAGANPFGGRVAIWGVALAAVVLQMISSGLNILGISSYVYQIVQGVILVGVMILHVERARVLRLLRRPRAASTTDRPVDRPTDRPVDRPSTGEGPHGQPS